MKIRKGFVSNSSSSSFLIVGITDSNLMKQIAVKDGKFENGDYCNLSCNYGVDTSGRVCYFGGWGEPQYIGDPIEKSLEEKTLPILRKEFQQKIKKVFNLEIPLDKIKLHYGEVGDG